MGKLIHHTSQYEGRMVIGGTELQYFYIDKNMEMEDDILLKIPDRWRTKAQLIQYLDGIKKIIEENF